MTHENHNNWRHCHNIPSRAKKCKSKGETTQQAHIVSIKRQQTELKPALATLNNCFWRFFSTEKTFRNSPEWIKKRWWKEKVLVRREKMISNDFQSPEPPALCLPFNRISNSAEKSRQALRAPRRKFPSNRIMRVLKLLSMSPGVSSNWIIAHKVHPHSSRLFRRWIYDPFAAYTTAQPPLTLRGDLIKRQL